MRVYHFLKKDYGLEALEKQRLKVATINDLNDPFELLAADISQSDERHKFIEWKNQISEKRGMLCFSKTWRNLLLWSHYADKHCGVALELEIKDDFIFPVQYSKKRLSLDIPVIMRAGGFTETLAEKLVSTKSAHWKYEKEVRVFVDLASCTNEDGLYFEQFTNQLKIVGIVVGAQCKLTAEDVRNKLPNGEKVILRHSRLAFKSFDIVQNQAKPDETIQAG